MSGFEMRTDDMKAAAKAAREIGEDLGKPVDAAIRSASTAAGQMTGWFLARSLDHLAGGWVQPLSALRQLLADTAANLDITVENHQWNDKAIADSWNAQVAR
ncbi:hypothetical protein OG689_15720 [Kitasatospora sp. NBC_00240]|uniref:hypothetical protein n=1 Tax=Kitasatospora sp. NBC_00240 TaxID=2903567 RepID=UPI002257CA4E|nr:hypothetical protein [Kitasatospora sp. NBC_00240]MCX5210718.1 hypothetical protein [Kitasatospora sp. NBC_00240]